MTVLPSEVTSPFCVPGFAGLVLTTPGEKKGSGSKSVEFYSDVTLKSYTMHFEVAECCVAA